MADPIKLVPVSWHNGSWYGDGTLEYRPPEGWQVRDVKDFRELGGNNYRALIVLEKSVK